MGSQLSERLYSTLVGGHVMGSQLISNVVRSLFLVIVLKALLSVSGAMAARGTVFHDKNQNDQRDKDEPGIKNIGVSNGKEVTKTNDEGGLGITAR